MSSIWPLIVSLFLLIVNAWTPWPSQFRIKFETFTQIPGVSYHNWDIQRMRIDHGPGSYECQRFYYTNDSCILYFAIVPPISFLWKSRTKLFVYFPANRTCCTDSFSVGPIDPNWLNETTFEGITGCPKCNTRSKSCNHYTKKGDRGMHHYWELLDGTPCAFTFADVAPQTMIYDTQTFDVSPQDREIFTPPVDCSRKCSLAY